MAGRPSKHLRFGDLLHSIHYVRSYIMVKHICLLLSGWKPVKKG